MYPIDPVETSSADPKPPMSPQSGDDNPNLQMTEKGLSIAENEKRDSVTDEYEKQAASSENTEEILDDIAYPKGNSDEGDPELSAMKKDPLQ